MRNILQTEYVIGKKLKQGNLIFLLLSIVLTSCLETIDIDLRSTAPYIVAEGQIEENDVAWIRLSYTTDYFNYQDTVYIDSASVYLSDDRGHKDTLGYSRDGIYLGELIRGRVGREYTLNIIGDNFNYSASTLLEAPAIIYSLSFDESLFERPGSPGNEYVATLKFRDDPFKENYYMVRYWKNDTLDLDSYTIFKDSYYVKRDTVIYTSFRNFFQSGERVRVRLYSIDKNAYNYYAQLNDLLDTGVGGASTPYNPKSNFGPSVVGYFFAFSYSSITANVR